MEHSVQFLRAIQVTFYNFSSRFADNKNDQGSVID